MNDRRRGSGDSGFEDSNAGSRPGGPARPAAPARPAGQPPSRPPPLPGAPPPASRTSPSGVGLPKAPAGSAPKPVPQSRTQTGSNPKAPVFPGGAAAPGGKPPARSPTGAPQRSMSSGSNPRVPIVGGLQTDDLTAAETPEGLRQAISASGFADDDDERTQLDSLMGAPRKSQEEDDEATTIGQDYDGKTPAKEVTARDLWKAINAPVQSRVGRRSAQLYAQVLDQFAVGNNPRYEPDGPDRPRAHIFVWDVTRAMNCEIPHFVGPRELTLSQTVDWIRHEGPMRGWRRIEALDVPAALKQGLPVVALPKEIRAKLIGMCRPGALGPDGRPLFDAAAKGRGRALAAQDAFGTRMLEYFVHS